MHDEQQWETTVLCLLTRISYVIRNNTVSNKNINKRILNSSRRIKAFLLAIAELNKKIIYKEDIKIVTWIPIFIGIPCMRSIIEL